MTGHPESDVLAEFQAGLVTGRRRVSIASHLAACDRCAGLSDQLGEISPLLAAAPPLVMPDDVAGRLDLALAAEAAQRHSSERAVADRPAPRASRPGPWDPRSPRRHWDLRLVTQRILLPAAAVVVLAAGGFGLSRITGASSTSSTSARSEAAPAATAAAPVPSARAAEPADGVTSRSGILPAIEAPLYFQVVNSRIDYLPATLRQQLQGELAQHAESPAGAQTLASGSLKACVLRVTGGTVPGTLTLVERARFQGQPAIVIVAVSGQHQEAWVVAAGCSASGDRVLATTTLPGTSAS